MKSLIGKEVRWPLCRLIFLLAAVLPLLLSCDSHEPLQPLIIFKEDSLEKERMISRAFVDIAALQKRIRSGDLVTRTGNDFTSQSLRGLNRRNKDWSHCGIASVENDSVFVYHALGGEWNPDEKLRRDPWILFAEPYSNNSAGLFRFALADSTITNLVGTIKEFYRNQLPFDMHFDLATDERMYCAEFIYKSFLIASKQQLRFNRSHINSFEFIGVDDLFLHPLCKKMAEIKYK